MSSNNTILRFLMCISLVFVLTDIIQAQTKPVLHLGALVERESSSGHSSKYLISLERGEYAILNVEQLGVDLKIQVYDISGKLLDEFDSLNGANGDETIVIDAIDDGAYSIIISPFEKKANYSYNLKYLHKTNDLKKHFDELLMLLSARNFIPGYALSIINKDTTIYKRAFGYMDIKNKKPYSLNTIQKIASISKTTIGIAIMQLIEQGKFTLETEINDILPFKVTNPYFKNDPIKLKHLVTHTSGINETKFIEKIGYVFDQPEDVKLKGLDRETKKVYKQFLKNEHLGLENFLRETLVKGGEFYKKKNFFKEKAGGKWYYSNTGSALAAYLVELISGMSYQDYTRKHIFEPLGMNSAVWYAKNSKQELNSELYTCNKKLLPRISTITYPDGELHLSIEDLNKYLLSFIKGYNGHSSVIRSASFREMMEIKYSQNDDDGNLRTSGIFWEFDKSGYMGHNGGDQGILTMMKFDPKSGIGLNIMLNTLVIECGDSYAQFQKIWSFMKRYGSQLDK